MSRPNVLTMRPADERSTERFRTLLANRRMTQLKLAGRTGIPQPTISQILAGRRSLTLAEACLISDALDVDLEDMACITGHRPAAL